MRKGKYWKSGMRKQVEGKVTGWERKISNDKRGFNKIEKWKKRKSKWEVNFRIMKN